MKTTSKSHLSFTTMAKTQKTNTYAIKKAIEK